MEINKKRFNRGNEYGRGIIRHSIKELGCGRSILVDRDGVVICGNEVYKIAKELGIKTITIETDGDTLVVVKRTDVSIKDKKGMELSLVDNLSQEKNLEWDADEVCEAAASSLSFNPQKWGGAGCMVKELNVEDLFKDDIVTKNKKNTEVKFTPDRQLSLFD